VEVVGDAALLFEPETERVDGRVVIAPCRTRGELWGGDDSAVFERLADTTRVLVERGHDVHLLACHPDDDGPCLQIMRQSGRPDLPYTAGYADLPGAVGLLASADLVIAERLHAGVLAAAAGTPFVALEYRPKLRDFAASVDMTDWVLKTDALDGLEERVLSALDERGQLSARMAPRVDDYRRRLRNASSTLEKFMNS
jgi:polysaccharide pyruvyl transferase WcaK-like protein